MELLKNAKDFLLLDGRQLAAEIREKPEHARKKWEKAYLWFHENFEIIIIVVGIILLGLLIYNHLDSGTGCTVKMTRKNQIGGLGENSSSTNTPVDKPPVDKPVDKPPVDKPPTDVKQKSKNELRAEAIQAAAETAEKNSTEKTAKAVDSAAQKESNTPGLIKKKADENRLKMKTFVKNIKGNTVGKVSGAWESVKSGEALELGKEKFADALYNSKDFIRQHAKAGYALAFTTFMVVGFGLFFVPTLIMFIIGGITLAIFNKQKMAFLANT